MNPREATLDDSFRYCRRVTRQASSTFYLASRMFARDVRRDLYAVYAFCRIADDIADAPGLSTLERQQELDLLLHTLKTERYSEGDLLWPAFFDVIGRHAIPITYFNELLEGVRADISPFEVKTLADLDRYSYLVAGTVGLMCTHILGQPDKQTLQGAKQLGIAMQYTNIMRDVSADAAIERVYLPSVVMKRHGLSRKDVLAGQNEEALRSVLAELAQRAQLCYDQAERAIHDLAPGNQRPVRIALNLYRGILNRIEQNHFSVYNKRIRLSLPLKLMVAIKTR